MSKKGTFWDFQIDKFDPHEDHIKQLKVGDFISMGGDEGFFEIDSKEKLEICVKEFRRRNADPNQPEERKLSNKLE